MKIIKFINYTKLPKDKLLLILQWRNSDYVRPWMINQNIISEETHLNFCKKLNDNHLKQYYLIESNEVPCGVINAKFEDDTYKIIADVGYFSFGIQKTSISTLAKYLTLHIGLKYNSQKVFLQIKKNNIRQTNIIHNLYPNAKLTEDGDIIHIEVDISDKNKVKAELKFIEKKMQASISFY